MKVLLLVPAALALLATGIAVGYGISGGRESPDAPAPAGEAEIVYRTPTGDTRVLTAAEAADRIERLELERTKRRSRVEPSDEEAQPAAAAVSTGDPPDPKFAHADGTPYTAAEIDEIARHSTDTSLRAAAIRELRRADTDAARATLQEVLADKTSPAAIREEAAKALAQPPNRDKLPEELVTALRDETDPAVRRALAQGVGRMRDRDAWMTDIVGLVHTETDPEVRKALFEAVVRDARDPVARAELLSVASNPGATIDERRAAIAAIPRGKTDPETLAKLESLMKDPDPRIRENAVSIVGSAQAISTAALAAAFEDPDPGVRRAALYSGAGRLPQFANDKSLPKETAQQLAATVVNLATSDSDPSVRRAAIQQVGNLPKAVRDQVLATGRDDPDLYVRLTSYARSPDPVAKQGIPLYVGALDSQDAGLRDFAYRQLQRLGGVTAPFDTRWNSKARTEAIGRIRQDLASGAH